MTPGRMDSSCQVQAVSGSLTRKASTRPRGHALNDASVQRFHVRSESLVQLAFTLQSTAMRRISRNITGWRARSLLEDAPQLGVALCHLAVGTHTELGVSSLLRPFA